MSGILFYITAEQEMPAEETFNLDYFVWAGSPQMAIIGWFEMARKALLSNSGISHDDFNYDGECPDELIPPYPNAVFVVPTKPPACDGAVHVLDWWTVTGVTASEPILWRQQYNDLTRDFHTSWAAMTRADVEEFQRRQTEIIRAREENAHKS
jgi:hypothetical protein